MKGAIIPAQPGYCVLRYGDVSSMDGEGIADLIESGGRSWARDVVAWWIAPHDMQVHTKWYGALPICFGQVIDDVDDLVLIHPNGQVCNQDGFLPYGDFSEWLDDIRLPDGALAEARAIVKARKLAKSST